jgi:hypothetical protein
MSYEMEVRHAARTRVKVPLRTMERVARLRRLIERLRDGEMTRDGAAEHLDMEDNAIRPYLAELVEGRMVSTRWQDGVYGRPVYTLIATPEQVEQFLGAAALAPRRQEFKPSVSQMAVALQGGRHVHLMQDDVPFMGKLPSQTVKPDPYALPTEFFRSRG